MKSFKIVYCKIKWEFPAKYNTRHASLNPTAPLFWFTLDFSLLQWGFSWTLLTLMLNILLLRLVLTEFLIYWRSHLRTPGFKLLCVRVRPGKSCLHTSFCHQGLVLPFILFHLVLPSTSLKVLLERRPVSGHLVTPSARWSTVQSLPSLLPSTTSLSKLSGCQRAIQPKYLWILWKVYKNIRDESDVHDAWILKKFFIGCARDFNCQFLWT